jgi:glycosyltransferase involved in cell wall biosynthesis
MGRKSIPVIDGSRTLGLRVFPFTQSRLSDLINPSTNDAVPLVSVVVPLFNRVNLVLETLRSVASQSIERLEVIVVDDGSTDGGVDAVECFTKADGRFRILCRTASQRGASVCRNIGLESASGKYVVFLDSDDLLAEGCLKKRVSYLEAHPIEDLVVTQGLIFRDTPGDQKVMWNSVIFSRGNFTERFLNQDMPWQTSGATWRRTSLQRIGPWDIHLCCFQDWELHLRACIKKVRIGFLPEPDFFIRRSETADQISSYHNRPSHVESRLRAFDLVVRLLESNHELSGAVRRAARGFLLRNHLGLHDAGCEQAAMLILQSKSARELLNPLDRWMLSWIKQQGESWHWNTRVKRIASIWWRNLKYDSLDMNIDFMKAEWLGDMPRVATQAKTYV